MNSEHQSELLHAKQKLSIFRNHLDQLLQRLWSSKTVDPNDILVAVNELQTLVEWATQQPDLRTESAVLLMQLQTLHKIRQTLVKSPPENKVNVTSEAKVEEESKVTKECEICSKELLDLSDIPDLNVSRGNGEANKEENFIPVTDNLLFEHSRIDNEKYSICDNDIWGKVESIDNEPRIDAVTNTNLNIKDSSINSLQTSVIPESGVVVPDLLSDGTELLIKRNLEIQELLSSTSEVIINSDQSSSTTDLLPTNDNAINSNTKIQDLLSNDFEYLINTPDINDIFSYDLDLLTKNSCDKRDISISENDGISNINSDIKENLLNKIEILKQPSTEICKEILINANNLAKCNTELLVLDSSSREIIPESNVEIIKQKVSGNSDPTASSSNTSNFSSTNKSISTRNGFEIERFLSQGCIPNTKPLRNEVIILEANKDNKTTEWINDPKNSNDPLDICMFAIRNLYDSLRAKENELLKFSVIQNDQKQIDALQGVIIDFHKDITNLNSQLDKIKKDNSLLKEQVLELEEAENDARSDAQKVEQKLIFLQEKDSHSQDEIKQLKHSLKQNESKLSEKELTEKELRSQMKYLETLVQKYEDQVKVMEAKEATSKEQEKYKTSYVSNKGTQTYPLPKVPGKLSDTSKMEQVIGLAKDSSNITSETGDKNPLPTKEATQVEDKLLVGLDMTSQKQLEERLHKLINKDTGLQQQIHNVDQINLDLWQKLQDLETNIDECRRKDITETNIKLREDGENGPIDEANSAKASVATQNYNIPIQNVMDITFEKVLRQTECFLREKDQKYIEWQEREKSLDIDLKILVDQRDILINQIEKLVKEKEVLEQRVIQQQSEIIALKEKNLSEIAKIKTQQEEKTGHLYFKVNQLISKEKELLKMITQIKTEKHKNQDKKELERLKCNYIELQLELSNERVKIRKIEEGFKIRLNECGKNYAQEENKLSIELENLRKEYLRYETTIKELQLKQDQLLTAFEQKENELQIARDNYNKSLEQMKEDRHSDENENKNKNKLEKMEEETVILTATLMEERIRVENELQEKLQDLGTKEEIYKERIAKLENEVLSLKDELKKVSEDSKTSIEVFENNNSATKDVEVYSNILKQPQPLENVLHEGSVPLRVLSPTQLSSETESSEIASRIDTTDENVQQLREQVRELQVQFERISGEVSEIPRISPLPPGPEISEHSNQLQDELDYAEVDESVADWRKPALQVSTPKNYAHKYQTIHGDKYALGYINKFKNKKALKVKDRNEENDYDELLPRPTNFHVVQQVGQDTLLVGWNYVNPSVLDGFEVYLDNQVHERIYIPDRTKALISGLNLRKSIRLSICALSRYGQISEPAVLELTCEQPEMNSTYENQGDEYRDFDDSLDDKHRPYSMEW